MGRLFLPRGLSLFWDAIVVFAFGCTLIYYIVEGVNVSAVILGVTKPQASAIFALPSLLFVSLVPNPQATFPHVVGLTAFKFVLLVVCALALAALGATARVMPSSDWRAAMSPFLMVSYIIGGAAGYMPGIVSGRSLATRQGVVHFLYSSLAALVVFSVLTVVWGLGVLHAVPQTEADAAARGLAPDLSLAWETAHGELAAFSLLRVIQGVYPSYDWMVPCINIMLIGFWLCFIADAFAFNHAITGFAASLAQAIAPWVGVRDVSSAEILDLLSCDEPPSWESAAADGGLAPSKGCCWVWASAGALWRSNRRLRLLLSSRGALFFVNCLLCYVLSQVYHTEGIWSQLATLTANIGGGVVPGLLYMGARKRTLQQPGWLPDMQARRLASAGAGQPHVVLASAPYALPEHLGYANMVLVFVTFTLAAVYQVFIVLFRNAGEQWALAALGACVVLCLYHLVPELSDSCARRPLLEEQHRSAAPPAKLLESSGRGDDMRVSLLPAEEVVRSEESFTIIRQHGAGAPQWGLSYTTAAEIAELCLWIVHGTAPRVQAGEGTDWSLLVAGALTAFHLALRIMGAVQRQWNRQTRSGSMSVPVQTALAVIDIAVLLCCAGVLLYDTSRSGGTLAVMGGVAALCVAIVLAAAAVLRLRQQWRSTLEAAAAAAPKGSRATASGAMIQ